MEREREVLAQLIDKAELSGDWKKILQDALTGLWKHNDAVMAELKTRAKEESQGSKTKPWEIITLLADCQNSGLQGLSDMMSHSKPTSDMGNPFGEPLFREISGGFFLDCAYEELAEFYTSEYEGNFPFQGILGGKTFPYRFSFDGRYIGRERELYRIASFYSLNQPLIFSPYSRRAVKIQIPLGYEDVAEALKEEPTDTAPYRLAENGLTGKLLVDKTLFWNLQFYEKKMPVPYADGKSASYAPYGDRDIYRYVFQETEENCFLAPGEIEAHHVFAARKNRERQELILLADKPIHSDAMGMRLYEITENNWDFYRRQIGKTAFLNQPLSPGKASCCERLRTRGEIEKALYCLSLVDYGGFACDLQEIGSARKEAFAGYPAQLAYGLPDIDREQAFYSANRAMPYCYVSFSGEKKFLGDYANFILHFLRGRFPEYNWAGVW